MPSIMATIVKQCTQNRDLLARMCKQKSKEDENETAQTGSRPAASSTLLP